MMRRLWLGVAAGGLGAACALLPATPAAADLVDPPGACVASAAWSGGPTIVSQTGDPDDVTVIPRQATVDWSGTVVGPTAGTARPVDGAVELDLPPLFGGIPIGDWGGSSTDVKKTGTYSYDLPSLVPAGVIFTVVGWHDENGKEHCDGSADLKIAGGVFDSPLIWGDLGGLVLLGALLALVGRRSDGGAGFGRLGVGALLGLLFFLFVALTLVLLGVLPLASPVVTVLLGLGLVLGGAWGRWAPLGVRAP